jgi:ubiquitin-protein ligase/uncharacterized membrane protein YgcG
VSPAPLPWASLRAQLRDPTFISISKHALANFEKASAEWSSKKRTPPGGVGSVLYYLWTACCPALHSLKAHRDAGVAAERAKYSKSKTAAAASLSKASGQYWASGTGYGGTNAMQAGDMAKSFAAQNSAFARQQATDAAEQGYLEQALDELQQCQNRSLLCHPVVSGALLRDLVPICAHYLSTSFADMCDRHSLFSVVLDLVSFFTKHSGLQHVLYVAPDECDDDDDDDDAGGDDDAGAGALPPPPSISQLLGGLSQQAALIVSALSSGNSRKTKEAKATLSLSGKITACCNPDGTANKNVRGTNKKQRIADALDGRGGSSSSSSRRSGGSSGGGGVDLTSRSGAQHDSYCSVLSQMKMKSMPLLAVVPTVSSSSSSAASSGPVTFSYHYRADAAKIKTQAVKRLRRIGKELAALSNSLPITDTSSILICVDENRPDCIKAVIVGPAGTPYENGLFEFDILLPATYPNQAPKVILVTTGGGRIRFNPNLYNNGKVCLSLLGTWKGPGWHHKCTLLQVLISIQSLILVDEPFFNEPGFEQHQGSEYGRYASKVYNQRIREATIRYAMIPHLMRPDASPFAELIREHFGRRSLALRAQTGKWLKQLRRSSRAPQSASYNRGVFAGGVTSSTVSSLQAATDDLNTRIGQLVSERAAAAAAKRAAAEEVVVLG